MLISGCSLINTGVKSYVLYSVQQVNRQTYAGTQPRPGVFKHQLAAMRLGRKAAQVQAQPYTACAALAGGIQPKKCLAWLRQLVCRYAWAVVAHRQLQRAGCARQADVYRPLAVALGVVRDSRQIFRFISGSVN